VIGQAVTGSGKTLAFAMPLVNALKDAPKSKGLGKQPAAVQALILTPTRELCKQVGGRKVK
jgi:superfamily II DNA/RNA helicase